MAGYRGSDVRLCAAGRYGGLLEGGAVRLAGLEVGNGPGSWAPSRKTVVTEWVAHAPRIEAWQRDRATCLSFLNGGLPGVKRASLRRRKGRRLQEGGAVPLADLEVGNGPRVIMGDDPSYNVSGGRPMYPRQGGTPRLPRQAHLHSRIAARGRSSSGFLNHVSIV